MSGGPSYILHEMMSVFFSWPLTNISSVIHKLCPNRFHKDHASKFLGSILGKLTSTTKFWYIDRNPNVLFFFFSQHTYITILIRFSGAFTCLCFPPSSCIRSFKGTYHSSPGPDNIKTRWLPILPKKVVFVEKFYVSPASCSWVAKPPGWASESYQNLCFIVCLRS